MHKDEVVSGSDVKHSAWDYLDFDDNRNIHYSSPKVEWCITYRGTTNEIISIRIWVDGEEW